MPPRPSRPSSWYLPNPTVRPTMLSNCKSPLATVAWQRRRPTRPLYLGHPPLSLLAWHAAVDLRLRMQVRSPASSESRGGMLFHVTITHSQADCPGRRPAETPDLIGPADRLEALGDELSVTSHSLVWGASCILWAAPEHVAYALLEAPSLEAVEGYVDALIPPGWESRAQPVFLVPTQLATVRQLLTLPVIAHEQPAVVVAEPADEADTLKGVTIAQAIEEPPHEEEPPEQQVTRAIPTPVFDQPDIPAAEAFDQQ